MLSNKSDNLSSHVSSDYDEIIMKTIPYYHCFHEETINLVRSIFQHPAKWLDTGCGTGNLIGKAFMEFPGCQFYLADPSEEMLKICKEKYDSSQIKIIGNYDTANIQTEYRFDVITAIQSHHYMSPEKRAEAIKKCLDLLEDGGLYMTFENIKPESSFGIENGLKRWGDFQLKNGRQNQEVENHKKRFDKKYFPIKISEHLDLMQQAGFRTVELFWMSHMQAGFYGIK
jgi:tRNA (cmo5U34)-methyltransferase